MSSAAPTLLGYRDRIRLRRAIDARTRDRLRLDAKGKHLGTYYQRAVPAREEALAGLVRLGGVGTRAAVAEASGCDGVKAMRGLAQLEAEGLARRTGRAIRGSIEYTLTDEGGGS